MPTDGTDLERLIRAIYRGASEAEALEPAFRDIMSLVGATTGWVNAFTPLTAIALVPGVNLNPEIHDHYAEYYRLVDPWATKALHVIPRFTPRSTEHFVSKREFLDSEVYNDLILRTRTDIVHNLALTFPVGDDIAAISLMRGLNAEPFDQQEEQLLSIVGPHLIRMLTLRHEAQEARERRADFASDVGDHCRFALDWDGRLREINRGAARMLASSRLVSLTVDHRLSWWHAAEAQYVDKLFIRAARLGIGGSLTLHDRDGVVYQMVLDVTPGMRDEDAPMLVTIVDLPALIDRQVKAASLLFSLSPSEIALAVSLMLGRTIEEHADRRGATRETVRKQLAALFRKVGVSRQAALVACLFALPARAFD